MGVYDVKKTWLKKHAPENVGLKDYEDDFDDNEYVDARLGAGNTSDLDDSSEDEEEKGSGDEDGEDNRWQGWQNLGRGGKAKGKGKGRSSKGPTQGQTYQARRKEQNKAV